MWIHVSYSSAILVSIISCGIWYIQVFNSKIYYLLATIWPVVSVIIHETEQGEEYRIWEWLGLELTITNYAAVIAASGVTVVGMGGPLIHLSIRREDSPVLYMRVLISSILDNLLLRSCIFSSMLLAGMHSSSCIYITALCETALKLKVLLFGRLKSQEALFMVSSNGVFLLIQSCYLSYIYLITHCLYASICCQFILSMIGVPDLECLNSKSLKKYRGMICLAYLLGGICFVIIMPKILNPEVFKPWPYEISD
jgi:hypothetical protein